ETKKIKHTIDWRQYKEDDLVVSVTSSNPTAVIVPGELKLNFEKNAVDFSYDLRAGTTDGDFTVTVQPKVGKKVEVKVTVKSTRRRASPCCSGWLLCAWCCASPARSRRMSCLFRPTSSPTWVPSQRGSTKRPARFGTSKCSATRCWPRLPNCVCR